jgi:hypothetical protein
LRGKNSQYSFSLNQAHLMSNSSMPVTAAITNPATGHERGMLGEPTGDCRGRDSMAVTGRDFFCRRFKRVAVIVLGQCFEDLRERTGLIAERSAIVS